MMTSPDGLHAVTIINDSSGNAKVLEDGNVVWQQSGAVVGEALFSPDSQHLALVVKTSSGWEVIDDGNVVGSGFSSVGALTFSADGSDLAFITYTGTDLLGTGGLDVVENGTIVSSTYYAITNLQFSSSDQLSFTAYQSDTPPSGITPMFIMLDQACLMGPGVWGNIVGGEGPSIPVPSDPVTITVAPQNVPPEGQDSLASGTIPSSVTTAQFSGAPQTIISPNGLHTAIITNFPFPFSSEPNVTEDGNIVWQQSGAVVGEALFSPDGQHLALVVESGGLWSVIEDGKTIGSGYSLVSSLTFSQDGNDLAFIAYTNSGAGGLPGYEVIENGVVSSNTYYSVGNLQFASPSDQLSFTAYQSAAPSVGLFFNPPETVSVTSLTGTGVWGNVFGYNSPSAPAAIDPETLIASPPGSPDSPGESQPKTNSTGSGSGNGTSQPVSVAPIIQAPTPGNHTIDGPNGKKMATVINGVRGGSEVFEGGTVVWQKMGAQVGEAVFSANGKNLALAVLTKTGWEVIENGKVVGSGYSSLSGLTFSSNGSDLAYIASSTSLATTVNEVVENGKVEYTSPSAIGNLQFNPLTNQLTYLANVGAVDLPPQMSPAGSESIDTENSQSLLTPIAL